MHGSHISQVAPVKPGLQMQNAFPCGVIEHCPFWPHGPLLKHGSLSSHNRPFINIYLKFLIKRKIMFLPKKPGGQLHWKPPGTLFDIQIPPFKHLKINVAVQNYFEF